MKRRKAETLETRCRVDRKADEGNTIQMTSERLQNKPQHVIERGKGLPVGQDWKVGADSLNIILYQRHINKKTGKEYWRVHSYYATVANALVELVNQGVRDTELADMKVICGKIDQLQKDIGEYLFKVGRKPTQSV